MTGRIASLIVFLTVVAWATAPVVASPGDVGLSASWSGDAPNGVLTKGAGLGSGVQSEASPKTPAEPVLLAVTPPVSDEAPDESPTEPRDIMFGLYHHVTPHYYGEHNKYWPYVEEDASSPLALNASNLKNNHVVAFLFAAVLLLLLFNWLARRRHANLKPTGRLQNTLEALVLFVRDEMVYGVMGKEEGKRFLPLFLTQFFMILAMNLFGIIPNPAIETLWGGTGPGTFISTVVHFPTTATANVSITAGLALVTFCVILFQGIKRQGPGGYIVNLAPSVDLGPGKANQMMQKGVMCILYPIEILGLFIKPMALMIRLFANMTGGHMALLTIYGLIFFAGVSLSSVAITYPIMFAALGFNIFLTFLELLVAVLQAYIFTYLSIIFVNASLHAEH